MNRGTVSVEMIVGITLGIMSIIGVIAGIVSYGEGIKSDVRSVTERVSAVEGSYTAAVGDIGKKIDTLSDKVVEQQVDVATIKGVLRSTSGNFGASPAAVDMIERKIRDQISTSTPEITSLR